MQKNRFITEKFREDFCIISAISQDKALVSTGAFLQR